MNAANCLHIEENGLAEMKGSLSRCYLTEQVTGTSRGGVVSRAKKTLHLYGIANHHSDTYYMSYRIKAGTAQNTAQAGQTQNFMKNVLPISRLIRNSISTDSISQKCFSLPKIRNFAQAVHKSECGTSPSASRI